MKYERLTERDEYGRAILKDETVNKDIVESNLKFGTLSVLDKVVSQFCDLEDKIEAGTMIELPCKIGNKVYYLEEYVYGEVKYLIEVMWVAGFKFSKYDGTITVVGEYGESATEVFLTKEDAEKRLKELRCEL